MVIQLLLIYSTVMPGKVPFSSGPGRWEWVRCSYRVATWCIPLFWVHKMSTVSSYRNSREVRCFPSCCTFSVRLDFKQFPNISRAKTHTTAALPRMCEVEVGHRECQVAVLCDDTTYRRSEFFVFGVRVWREVVLSFRRDFMPPWSGWEV